MLASPRFLVILPLFPDYLLVRGFGLGFFFFMSG